MLKEKTRTQEAAIQSAKSEKGQEQQRQRARALKEKTRTQEAAIQCARGKRKSTRSKPPNHEKQ